MSGSRPMLDRLLANVVPGARRDHPDWKMRGLPAIGMTDHAAVRAANELPVTTGVVGNPDRRPWFGGRLWLDGDILEAVVLALVADVILGPEQLENLDPLGQPLHAILVGDVVRRGFDLIRPAAARCRCRPP